MAFEDPSTFNWQDPSLWQHLYDAQGQPRFNAALIPFPGDVQLNRNQTVMDAYTRYLANPANYGTDGAVQTEGQAYASGNVRPIPPLWSGLGDMILSGLTGHTPDASTNLIGAASGATLLAGALGPSGAGVFGGPEASVSGNTLGALAGLQALSGALGMGAVTGGPQLGGIPAGGQAAQPATTFKNPALTGQSETSLRNIAPRSAQALFGNRRSPGLAGDWYDLPQQYRGGMGGNQGYA